MSRIVGLGSKQQEVIQQNDQNSVLSGMCVLPQLQQIKLCVILGYINIHRKIGRLFYTGSFITLHLVDDFINTCLKQHFSPVTEEMIAPDLMHLFGFLTGVLSRVRAANVMRTLAPMTTVIPTTHICPLT